MSDKNTEKDNERRRKIMKLKNLLPIVILGAFILAPSTADAQFDKTWKD